MAVKLAGRSVELARRDAILATLIIATLSAGWLLQAHAQETLAAATLKGFDGRILASAIQSIQDGRKTFRFDTFGDEAFWGGELQLNRAIEGGQLGGLGAGISPNAALKLGLKVDVDALTPPLLSRIKTHQLNLDDPATTLALLKLNAVVGLKGFFTGNQLSGVGITCALCHSTVDNSLAFGIGHRLDGWANRDLDVGQIIAAAPDLGGVANLLGVNRSALVTVLKSWGPGKFDAELFLDGNRPTRSRLPME